MMTLHSIALFLHIVGALGLFVALGLEWAGLLTLRRLANIEQARGWVNLIASLPRLYGFIWMAILLPGLYLALTVWGWDKGWIVVSLASMVVFPILGAAVSGSKLQVIGRIVTSESGQLSTTFHDLVSDPFLWASIHVRTAIALGIVFLMTIKPSWDGAVVSIGIAALLGLTSILPILRSRNA